jgi:hypothetical protein
MPARCRAAARSRWCSFSCGLSCLLACSGCPIQFQLAPSVSLSPSLIRGTLSSLDGGQIVLRERLTNDRRALCRLALVQLEAVDLIDIGPLAVE